VTRRATLEWSEGRPQAFKTDRSQVNAADSIGISLRKGKQEGAVVLFEGGWCDFISWDGDADEAVQDAPEATTAEQYGKVLDRLAELFT
jgi:hypothetical protein